MTRINMGNLRDHAQVAKGHLIMLPGQCVSSIMARLPTVAL